MPKVQPLPAARIKRTIVSRLGRTVDRVRQVATNLGIRPYRVFLVWTSFTGDERGEGDESVLQRIELLPTPKVESLDGINVTPFAAGTLPVGALRVSRVSTSYTSDQLNGRYQPAAPGSNRLPANIDFFYEIVEDGRSGDVEHRRFRVATAPVLHAGAVQWVIGLERVSEDTGSDGTSQIGVDEDLR